ncbi:MAG: hypothetical protein WBB67_12185 [bacterium]
MTEIERNIFMFLTLAYLFVILLCWGYIQRTCSEFDLRSGGWFLLFSMNAAAIAIFMLKGMPAFVEGAQPSLRAFVIAVLGSGFLFFNRIEILGNLIIDTLAVSCLLVCIASVLPLGVYYLLHNSVDLNDLTINWIILSLIIAIISRVYIWLTNRR